MEAQAGVEENAERHSAHKDDDKQQAQEGGAEEDAWEDESELSAVWAIFAETFPALLLSGVFALIPGYFLSMFSSSLMAFPGLLTLVPGLIGMRGNIFGALCAKLSTLEHKSRACQPEEGANPDAGQQQAKKEAMAREQTARHLCSMAEVLLLSLLLPLGMYSLAAVGIVDQVAPIGQLLFVCLLSAVVSGYCLLATARFIVAEAARRGINPDNVAPPIITTLGDAVTLPLISFCAHLARITDPGLVWLANGFGVAGMVLLFVMVYFKCPKVFVSTVKERVPVLLSCLVLSTISGSALESHLTQEVSQGYLYLVPLINSQGGNAGSVFASRISTGLIPSSGVKVPSLVKDKIKTLLAPTRVREGMAVTASVLCVLALVTTGSSALVQTVQLLDVLLFSSMAVVIGVCSLSLAIFATWASLRFGLDPDNTAIAIVCAVMDVIGTWAFVGLLAFTVAETAG